MKTLKISIAYWRSLYFEDVDYNTAKELFMEFMKKLSEIKKDVSKADVSFEFPKKLQDYIMHFILKTAEENNFIVQIHTGLQEGMRKISKAAILCF
jgi:xylose isomerase